MIWIFLAMLITAMPVLIAQPSQAVEATTCDLATKPDKYNGKLVRIRARVRIEFEAFGIDADTCGEQASEFVALEYGKGPKRQPTIWCCGDMVPRDSLKLKQDKSFREFHRYLTGQDRTDGCYEGQCYRYRVTATLTGRFDAASRDRCPNGRGFCCSGAFGHFNMTCSRIVISSVADVIAEPVANPR